MGTGPIANASAIGADLPSHGKGEASAQNVMSAIPGVERHLAAAFHREPKLTDAGLLSGSADGRPGGRHGSEADAPFGATRQGPRPVPSRSCRLADKGPRPGTRGRAPEAATAFRTAERGRKRAGRCGWICDGLLLSCHRIEAEFVIPPGVIARSCTCRSARRQEQSSARTDAILRTPRKRSCSHVHEARPPSG